MILKIDFSSVKLQTFEEKGHPCPKDIWFHILSYISPRSELRHVISAARTCKTFYLHFLEEIKLKGATLKGLSSLSQLNGVPIHEHIPQQGEFGSYLHPQFLAVSAEGIQFFTPKVTSEQYMLFMLQFSEISKSFGLNSLNILKATMTDKKLDRSFHYYLAQCIVQIHPMKDGIIVVTQGGASVWKSIDGKLEYQTFYSPFETFSRARRVFTSAYHEGVLYLQYDRDQKESVNNFDDLLCKIDLRSDAPQVVPFALPNLNLIPTSAIMAFEGHFYCWRYGDSEQTLIEHDLNSQQIPVRAILPREKEGMTTHNSTNWFIVPSGNNLQVFDLATNKIVLGLELNIVKPRSDEVLTIRDDFLIVSYAKGDFRVFYLPAKKELTKTLRPILDRYLKKKVLSLFSLAFTEDSMRGSALNLLFLVTPHSSDPYHAGQQLFEVKVFLEEFEVPQPKTVESQPLLEALAPKSLSAKHIPKESFNVVKVYFVAAALFALIGVVSYFTLKAYAPESILDMGHGIHIHSAELSACIFGAFSLTLIAIGTYRYWKENNYGSKTRL